MKNNIVSHLRLTAKKFLKAVLSDSMQKRVRRWLKKDLVKAQVGSHEMFLDINDGGIGRALYVHGGREKEFMLLLEEEVQADDVCLDLGANIGYTTLTMASKAKHVLAVEPDPHNFRILKENIRLNEYSDKVDIYQKAISDRDSHTEFWIADRPNLNSMQKTKHSKKKIDVVTETLSTFLGSTAINFIKMDVEGHEVEILKGGRDYFAASRQHVKILIEVHPMYYSVERSFAKVLEEYLQIGFHFKFVVSTPMEKPKLFEEAGYHPKRVIPTDGRVRGIYDDVKNEDAIRFSCFMQDPKKSDFAKIVRAILIEKKAD